MYFNPQYRIAIGIMCCTAGFLLGFCMLLYQDMARTPRLVAVSVGYFTTRSENIHHLSSLARLVVDICRSRMTPFLFDAFHTGFDLPSRDHLQT